MVSSQFISGNWKGEFTYGPEYGKWEGKKATFKLFIEENNENGFRGKAFDVEGFGVNPDMATVRGFFEDDTISFVKQYLSSAFFEEDGSLRIIRNKPSAEIHYTGNYIESKKMFIGDWEVEISEVSHDGEYLEYLFTGTWEMRKDND